jgi:hypothetical protein
MPKRIFLLLFFILFFQLHTIYAQNDTLFKKEIYLKIDNFNFNKNNEYFNLIADGYTILGTQLHPKITYKLHPQFQLEFGVFGLYNFGNEAYSKIIPTFSLDYKLWKLDMTVGTLHNENLHQLIAPLMTSETLLDERRLENGSQLRYNSDKWKLDAWLNWETFIQKGDSKHEELVGGITLDYLLINQPKWQLKIPVQNLFYHHGGQVNTDLLELRNTYTMWHKAIGFDAKHFLNSSQSVQFKTYFLHHQSTSIPQDLLFTKGTGLLTELEYQYKHFTIGVGYWKGNDFVSPRGDDIFQSVSKKTDLHYIDGILQPYYAGHTEPDRSLFLGKLSYKKELYPDLFVATEVNFFYQNYTSQLAVDPENRIENLLDYNYSVKVRYSGLLKIK